MADIKGNDNIKEFSYENSELASIVVNNNGAPITFGKGAPEGSFTVGNTAVSANGTYLACDSGYDGFDQVVVDVPLTTTETKSASYSQSGSYNIEASTGKAISSASIVTNVTDVENLPYITEPDEYTTVGSSFICFNNGGEPFIGINICTSANDNNYRLSCYAISDGSKSLQIGKTAFVAECYHSSAYILSADRQCILRAYRFY
ncbi:MAG: hypothetical protein J6S67_12610 [Methanobrevibacter sp.]|nr:hypothetical protein [Methanobrevibacter sp.]